MASGETGAYADFEALLLQIQAAQRFTEQRVQQWCLKHPDDRVPLAVLERVQALVSDRRSARRSARVLRIREALSQRLSQEKRAGILWSPIRDRLSADPLYSLGLETEQLVREHLRAMSPEVRRDVVLRIGEAYSEPRIHALALDALPSECRSDPRFVKAALDTIFVPEESSSSAAVLSSNELFPDRVFQASDPAVAEVVLEWVTRELDRLREDPDSYPESHLRDSWIRSSLTHLFEALPQASGRMARFLGRRIQSSDDQERLRTLVTEFLSQLERRHMEASQPGSYRDRIEAAFLSSSAPVSQYDPDSLTRFYERGVAPSALRSLVRHPDAPKDLLSSIAHDHPGDFRLILEASKGLASRGAKRQARRLQESLVERCEDLSVLADLWGQHAFELDRRAVFEKIQALVDSTPDTRLPGDLPVRVLRPMESLVAREADSFHAEDVARLYGGVGRTESAAIALTSSPLADEALLQAIVAEHRTSERVHASLARNPQLASLPSLQEVLFEHLGRSPSDELAGSLIRAIPDERRGRLFEVLTHHHPRFAVLLLEHHLEEAKEGAGRPIASANGMASLITRVPNEERERLLSILGELPGAFLPEGSSQAVTTEGERRPEGRRIP